MSESVERKAPMPNNERLHREGFNGLSYREMFGRFDLIFRRVLGARLVNQSHSDDYNVRQLKWDTNPKLAGTATLTSRCSYETEEYELHPDTGEPVVNKLTGLPKRKLKYDKIVVVLEVKAWHEENMKINWVVFECIRPLSELEKKLPSLV